MPLVTNYMPHHRTWAPYLVVVLQVFAEDTADCLQRHELLLRLPSGRMASEDPISIAQRAITESRVDSASFCEIPFESLPYLFDNASVFRSLPLRGML